LPSNQHEKIKIGQEIQILKFEIWTPKGCQKRELN